MVSSLPGDHNPRQPHSSRDNARVDRTEHRNPFITKWSLKMRFAQKWMRALVFSPLSSAGLVVRDFSVLESYLYART